ncbi:MAG: alkaline shock response membrane anchor protein AmaP [Chloroflexi bacterium]|nr:alkaline shock response membrane anchor protein AmaP [Chloroflexota bacterium]
MNIFNRLFMAILMLVVLAVAFIVTVWPHTWTVAANYMTYLSQAVPLWYIVGGVAVMLVAALLLILELRRPRRSKYVVVDKVGGGDAKVLVESVSRRLNYQVDLLQDVSDVKTRIMAKGRGLQATLDVLMSPDADVPMKTEEIIATAHRVIEEDMGLRLAGKPKDAVRVNIRHPKEMPTPIQRELPPAITERPADLPELDLPADPLPNQPAATEPTWGTPSAEGGEEAKKPF